MARMYAISFSKPASCMCLAIYVCVCYQLIYLNLLHGLYLNRYKIISDILILLIESDLCFWLLAILSLIFDKLLKAIAMDLIL